ncbi:MAG: hypothetical protein HYV63_18595, partial [Candidatus Schekmanbacteria bacterium]|nr:hypothetical protein [Candidatus Schekmanbacteria bacterium]
RLADADAAAAAALAVSTLVHESSGIGMRPPAVGSRDGTPWEVTLDVSSGQVAATIAHLLNAVGSTRVTDVKVAERSIDEIFSEIYRQPRSEL